MMGGKAKRRRSVARVQAMAVKGSNTLVLDMQEDVTRLSHAQVEISTGMRFLVQETAAAKESRASIHDKLNDLREGHADIKARVGALERESAETRGDVGAIREDVNRHEARYQQKLGETKFWTAVCKWLGTARAGWTLIATAAAGSGAWWMFWKH